MTVRLKISLIRISKSENYFMSKYEIFKQIARNSKNTFASVNRKAAEARVLFESISETDFDKKP